MATDYLQAMGVGAGFDTKKIVTALVTAEKASKQSSIDRGTADVNASVSAMAVLKSSLQTLQTAVQKVDDQNDFDFSPLLTLVYRYLEPIKSVSVSWHRTMFIRALLCQMFWQRLR